MRILQLTWISVTALSIALCGFAIQIKAAESVAAQSERANAMALPTACDEACLTAIMDRYLAALVKHDPSGLPFAETAKFTENHEPITIGEGTWKTVQFMKFHGETFADPRSGEVAYMGAVQEDYVSPFMVRLKIAGGKITEVETIVSHGSAPQVPAGAPGVTVATASAPAAGPGIGAPDLALMAVIKPYLEDVLPDARRSTREKLIAIANSYFDGLQGTTKNVPFAPGCNRVENGNLTTNNPTNSQGGAVPASCKEQFDSGQFSYIERVRDRRFSVIDEGRGLILAQVVFDVPGRKTVLKDGKEIPAPPAQASPRSNVLNEVLKIDNGQITLLQAVMLSRESYGTKSGWN